MQEHRFYHTYIELKYHVGQGWTFLSASAWKNSTNSTIDGVGMLLSPTAFRSLNNFEMTQLRAVVAI